jgi:uncharacterized protein YjbI with pentapeptide repeats
MSATLKGVNLIYVRLDGANFERANLTGAALSGQKLRGMNLVGANLTEAVLHSVTIENSRLNNAKFIKADLTRSGNKDCNFCSNIDFNNAIMTNITIQHSEFLESDFREAFFRDVVLHDVDFRGGKFSNNQVLSGSFYHIDLYGTSNHVNLVVGLWGSEECIRDRFGSVYARGSRSCMFRPT